MSTYDCEVELGRKYRDAITGFQGTATQVTFQLNGCPRVQLKAMVDNKPGDYWFDTADCKQVDSDLDFGLTVPVGAKNGHGG